MSELNPPNFFGQPASGATGQWSWEFTGDAFDLEPPVFATRLDAQAWLGENIKKLRTAAVTGAQLTHRGEPVGQVVEL